MGLFDKIGGAIGGALEGLGRTAGTLIEGITPIAAEALGTRLAEKLGPRGSMPGTVAAPRGFPQIPRPITPAPIPRLPTIFDPAGGSMANNPFGSGPFLPPQAAGFTTANALGPVVRQLPGLLGGIAAGEALDMFAGGACPTRRGGSVTIPVGQPYKQTAAGNVVPQMTFLSNGEGLDVFVPAKIKSVKVMGGTHGVSVVGKSNGRKR